MQFKWVPTTYADTGCNLKTAELLDCVLIGVCAVIRLNMVFKFLFYFSEKKKEMNSYELIPHPTYSTDLVPSDYFPIPKLEKGYPWTSFPKKSWRQLRSGLETRTLTSSVLG